MLALETDVDHIHFFVSAPPKDSPSKIVGLLNGHRSKKVRAQFPALAKATGQAQLWTSAYYVGTAGQVNAEVIRRYIMECQRT
ncbi:IS200/IS605 family transposase [Noviherbaspirillum malthae]|uniref:IS200/IS605 family transposase n=1 Tax=Noviherbaspirillum malthae TaxID=1260987 RepID=UPI0034DD3D1E